MTLEIQSTSSKIIILFWLEKNKNCVNNKKKIYIKYMVMMGNYFKTEWGTIWSQKFKLCKSIVYICVYNVVWYLPSLFILKKNY